MVSDVWYHVQRHFTSAARRGAIVRTLKGKSKRSRARASILIVNGFTRATHDYDGGAG